MARMLTGDALSAAVKAQTFIKRGEPTGVEGVKYDFHLGSNILKAKFKTPIDARKLPEGDRGSLTVESGEVVFVLTEEELDLPMDIVAQLSPKRKLSHAGVLTLGGFCVDPGYKGRLVLGLYNFSSTPFLLLPGRKVVAATFFQLEGSEIGTFPIPEPMLDFPDDIVATMQKYQPVAAQAMADALQRLQIEITTIRDDLRSHSEWYTRFEGSLERHDKQIGELLKSLSAEKDARVLGEDKMSQAFRSFEKKFDSTMSWLKGAVAVLATLATLIALPLIIAWITHKFWP